MILTQKGEKHDDQSAQEEAGADPSCRGDQQSQTDGDHRPDQQDGCQKAMIWIIFIVAAFVIAWIVVMGADPRNWKGGKKK
jgi:hypothetical protein